MPIKLIRNDITNMQVDAIVNAANSRLIRGGGVCGAIHDAAGPLLERECLQLGGCKTGEAKITKGYALPCRYVIHTVGPVWQGGQHHEKELLSSCYRNSLLLARLHGCASIAFPIISSGIFGYPKDQALKVAMDAVSDFLFDQDSDMMVYLVVFTKESVKTGEKLFESIAQFIDDRYVEEHFDFRAEASRSIRFAKEAQDIPLACCTAPVYDEGLASAPSTIEEALKQIDESFSQMILRKIKEKGIKNSECYKRANIDKKLFSKIANDVHYSPKKTTAAALAIALELPLDEAKELLGKAGYALSRSSRFDIIIEYCITHRIYNIHEVNIILYDFDQMTLGV